MRSNSGHYMEGSHFDRECSHFHNTVGIVVGPVPGKGISLWIFELDTVAHSHHLLDLTSHKPQPRKVLALEEPLRTLPSQRSSCVELSPM